MRNIFNNFIATRIRKKIEENFKGKLIVKLPNNKSFVIGHEKNALEINVISYKFFLRLLFKGTADVGYSYSRGEWKTKDLTKLLEVGLKNANILKSIKSIHNLRLLKFINLILHNNSIRRSKKQISLHYDIGNRFYEIWLDKTMTYSSAIFENYNDTLEKAQINKYNNLVKLLRMKKSDNVLEIGCGWGGFMKYVQDNVGSTITGITISKNQYRYAKELIKKNNKVLFLDYRNLNKTYDKIVSIEMFEAVGSKYWDRYFKVLYNSLNKKGIAVLQIITIDEKVFKSYKYSKDFIQKYIFPGGMLPTKNHIFQLAKKNRLTVLEKKSFSKDYARTLQLWREKFSKKWKDIEVMGYDDNFKRLWEFYLCYCEIGFRLENIDVSQFLINKE